MKVCTDSCVFGAWINPESAKAILDVGTGTGVLALMLAQRSNATVLGIEIDLEASRQATDNFLRSAFARRMECENISDSSFCNVTRSSRFDLICCNPPFFAKSSLSEFEFINFDRSAQIGLHTSGPSARVYGKRRSNTVNVNGVEASR